MSFANLSLITQARWSYREVISCVIKVEVG